MQTHYRRRRHRHRRRRRRRRHRRTKTSIRSKKLMEFQKAGRKRLKVGKGNVEYGLV